MCNKPNTPEYYTLVSICPYDGTPTVLGIFENLDAVMYRLKSCHTSCGDEYRIECFHLTTADLAAERYNEIQVNRAKAKLERQVVKDKVAEAKDAEVKDAAS